MTLLDEGINVISAINIQHIESVNEEVQEITGIEVKERVPDSVLQEADEVVNIDLTAEELISRLKAGKIYRPEKIQTALDNFFRTENILQLRELALKEVALRVTCACWACHRAAKSPASPASHPTLVTLLLK
jgi:two-component system sensor histidine kinase KdpD